MFRRRCIGYNVEKEVFDMKEYRLIVSSESFGILDDDVYLMIDEQLAE